VHAARGVARASHLEERRVAERMAESCEAWLSAAGLTVTIEREHDRTARQPGAGLAVWAESTSGACFGADRAGARGRSAEAIGRFVAMRLLEDLAGDATCDRHLADQLVPFAALARGTSRWQTPLATEHLGANLWLVERFGARTRLERRLVEVRGLGISRGGGPRAA
jgi:RNA 3'-terminal phosphate cyclase (ATP)